MDLNDLFTKFIELEQHYSNLRQRWEEDEQYYDGSFTFTLPENVNKIVPATGRNAVDIPATHIVTDQPAVHRNREVHVGSRILGDDDEVEQYLMSVLLANNQLSLTPPLHETSKFQFLRGIGVVNGPFLNMDAYENKEDDAVWFDCLDPLNTLIEPGPNPSQGFTHQILTVAEMEALADTDSKFQSFDKGARRSTDLLTLVEWYGFQGKGKEFLYSAWESAYTSGVVTDTPQHAVPMDWLVEPRDSGYPYLTLIPVLSGYGLRSHLPEKLAQSIYSEQVKTLLIGEAFALSVADGYMGAAAFERYRTSNPLSKQSLDVIYGAGSVSLIPEDVHPIEPSRIPDAVLQNYANMSKALEDALFSGVVGGQRPTGVDTATGLAILSGQARLKFGPPLSFLQGAVAKLSANIGRLIVHNKKLGTFYCMGRTIKPEQFHNDYHVKVELFSEAPEERQARIVTGNQWAALEKGPSEKHINETCWGIENYEEDLEQKMFERVAQGDAMQQALEAFIQLQAQAQQDQNAQYGGMNALRQINQAASAMRTARPGGLVQAKPLPGSVEMAATQGNMQTRQPALPPGGQFVSA